MLGKRKEDLGERTSLSPAGKKWSLSSNSESLRRVALHQMALNGRISLHLTLRQLHHRRSGGEMHRDVTVAAASTLNATTADFAELFEEDKRQAFCTDLAASRQLSFLGRNQEGKKKED